MRRCPDQEEPYRRAGRLRGVEGVVVGDALTRTVPRTLVLCVLAVVGLTAAAAYQPVPVLLLVIGVPLLVWGCQHPKRFLAAAVVACLLAKTAAQVSGIKVVDYLDEGAIAAALAVSLGPRLLRGQPIRSFPGLGWFLLFGVLGVVSGLVADVPLVVLGTGAALASKGILLSLAVAQVQWSPADVRRLAKGGVAFLFFIIACSLVNLAIPQTWQATVGNIPQVSYRAAIPSLIGPFVEPGTLGIMAALGFLAVVAWNTTMGGTRFTWLLSAGMALVAVFSFRRKTWLGMIGSFLWLSSRAGRSGVFPTALATVAGIVILFWSTLLTALQGIVATYFDQSEGTAARTLMTRDSFFVAVDHFPLGAGFGRFGSDTAATFYSPLYLERGYQNVWGLSERTGNALFLTDTMWPAILGEAGILGLLAFVFALVAVFQRLRRLSVDQEPIARWLGLTGIAWIFQYLLESTGNPVFVSPPSYVPLFLLVGLLGSFGAGSAGNDEKDAGEVPAGTAGRPDVARVTETAAAR
ncbi:O-antigen ligase family protein [Blastococcus sp. VKM Ac-2987]|uniref:O-antigen ligase family protein n=1 Tax=Blastococcus sp. VKM Ac-2987 TaxID=3004141 RepID=UPI0022AB692E|nr:O-antigen ligase family protein [Blastococcus sp. VKM Ac-2987]MCZ2858462.1 O-antigen ligase family protein [Blastococcus sp. VKM Ac-2987]